MLTLWSDLDRSNLMLDLFRRRMNSLFEAYEEASTRSDFNRTGGADATWAGPATNVATRGSEIVITALVPGFSDKDIKVTLHQDTLTVAGERKPDAPEGYSVHRQERGALRFSRSFTLTTRVDPERTSAKVKDGILTVTLAKHAEAEPRQIAINRG